LTYTLNDATAISQLLSSQNWTTKLALDSDATRADMVGDISNLAASVQSNSTVLFYFSGHGDLTNDNSTGIIAPYDTDFERNSDGTPIKVNGIDQILETTVISAPQLASMLAALPTKNVIVILDSCYSGNFVSSGSAIDVSPQDYSSMPSFSAFSTAVANFGSLLSANASAGGQKSPIVISAAGSEEFSYDGTDAMQHGVFTYFLLQAASKGDSNGDGVVTTTEAFAYTQKAIISWGSSLTAAEHANFIPFLPHISGGTRDLVLFTD
jgi:uncharacterized caspase-like protein